MKNKILLDNLRDLSIYSILSIGEVFENLLTQILGAVIIVVVNSLLIPLFKLLIKRIKEKINDKEINAILDNVDEKMEEELKKILDKMEGDNDDERLE